MNTEQKIIAWLESQPKDFQEGLSLLAQYKSRKNLVRILTVRGKSPRSLRTLQYELSKLTKGLTLPVSSQKQKPQKPAGIIQRPVKKNPHLTERIGNPDNDPVLHQLYIERNNCIKRSSSLKPTLEYLNKQERLQSSFRILAIEKEKAELNRKIEFYEKFGQLPPEVKHTSVDESNPLQVKTRIDNLRSRISRDKKALAAAVTLETKTKWETDLGKHQVELDYLLKIFSR